VALFEGGRTRFLKVKEREVGIICEFEVRLLRVTVLPDTEGEESVPRPLTSTSVSPDSPNSAGNVNFTESVPTKVEVLVNAIVKGALACTCPVPSTTFCRARGVSPVTLTLQVCTELPAAR
jgi:hypothetical protein